MIAREKRTPKANEQLVLAVLRAAARPLTAYDIHAQILATGARLFPSQVYRTLDRLVEQRAVRCIETSRTYILDDGKADAVTVCMTCGNASLQTMGETRSGILRAFGDEGFFMQALVVEALGYCADCAGRIDNERRVP